MNSSRRDFLSNLALCTCGLAVFISPTRLLAAKKKNNNKNRPLSKKGKAAELPVVKSVSGNTIKVGDKIYEVNEFTEIIVNGEESNIGKVRVGMQASIAGGPKEFGKNANETIYKATRIVARNDNQLAKKAAEANRKVAEQNRKANRGKKNRYKR